MAEVGGLASPSGSSIAKRKSSLRKNRLPWDDRHVDGYTQCARRTKEWGALGEIASPPLLMFPWVTLLALLTPCPPLVPQKRREFPDH